MDLLTTEFFDPARDGRLRLPRCPGCDAWWWYPVDVGPCCGPEYTWVEITPRATVFTFTEVHRRFVGHLDVPYRTALVVPDDARSIRLVVVLEGEAGISDHVALVGVAESENGPYLRFA